MRWSRFVSRGFLKFCRWDLREEFCLHLKGFVQMLGPACWCQQRLFDGWDRLQWSIAGRPWSRSYRPGHCRCRSGSSLSHSVACRWVKLRFCCWLCCSERFEPLVKSERRGNCRPSFWRIGDFESENLIEFAIGSKTDPLFPSTWRWSRPNSDSRGALQREQFG